MNEETLDAIPAVDESKSKSAEAAAAESDESTNFESTCVHVENECSSFVGNECIHFAALQEDIWSLHAKIDELKALQNNDGGSQTPVLVDDQPSDALISTFSKVDKCRRQGVGKERKTGGRAASSTALNLELEPILASSTTTSHTVVESDTTKLAKLSMTTKLDKLEENVAYVMVERCFHILNDLRVIGEQLGVTTSLIKEQTVGRMGKLEANCTNHKCWKKAIELIGSSSMCSGDCQCGAPCPPFIPTTDPPRNVIGSTLDPIIHTNSVCTLHEVCPIEVSFQHFEDRTKCKVVVNFAASASYTNYVKSTWKCNNECPTPVQIPWMKHLGQVRVTGSVAACMQFSSECARITFLMEVMETGLKEQMVVLGRDFVAKYVVRVNHRNQSICLNCLPGKKTVELGFVYSQTILKAIEATIVSSQSKAKSVATAEKTAIAASATTQRNTGPVRVGGVGLPKRTVSSKQTFFPVTADQKNKISIPHLVDAKPKNGEKETRKQAKK